MHTCWASDVNGLGIRVFEGPRNIPGTSVRQLATLGHCVSFHDDPQIESDAVRAAASLALPRKRVYL